MSQGFLRKSPTSFTTLVKQNTKTNSAPKSAYRSLRVQLAVPHQHERRTRGSVAKAKEVKVVRYRAYVHHGCWLLLWGLLASRSMVNLATLALDTAFSAANRSKALPPGCCNTSPKWTPDPSVSPPSDFRLPRRTWHVCSGFTRSGNNSTWKLPI